jgi:hypothetical protein
MSDGQGTSQVGADKFDLCFTLSISDDVSFCSVIYPVTGYRVVRQYEIKPGPAISVFSDILYQDGGVFYFPAIYFGLVMPRQFAWRIVERSQTVFCGFR